MTGQFYTKNYKYILQDLKIPENISDVVEPFTGEGDLINFLDKDDYYVKFYDIDPKKKYIIKRDTLLNPPAYKNKFILTNPPYLSRNKCHDKTIFNKYKSNDLYKCFLESILKSNNLPSGGIIIIPTNFFLSIRKYDINLRKRFLDKFGIKNVNIFEEKVFEYTSYSVCSFLFLRRENKDNAVINVKIFPSKKELNVKLNDGNNFIFGGEIYNLKQNENITISRVTRENENSKYCTNIRVKCIDDKIKINLSISDEIFVDNTKNLSQRSYCSLYIFPKISLEKQKLLCDRFNIYFNNLREKYHSLFLTTYREGSRKRISFYLIYKICNYILSLNKVEDEFEKLNVDENDRNGKIILLQKHIRGFLQRRNILIPSSSYQSKTWRKNRAWYENGKKNECEKYQISLIGKITECDMICNTKMRLNMETHELKYITMPFKYDNAFDWTEDFDLYQNYDENITFYYNLKFISGSGGAQTRSLREAYHFIKSQLNHILSYGDENTYFINVLDGNECYRKMDKIKFLTTLDKYKDIKANVFIGDMKTFQKWFYEIIE